MRHAASALAPGTLRAKFCAFRRLVEDGRMLTVIGASLAGYLAGSVATLVTFRLAVMAGGNRTTRDP